MLSALQLVRISSSSYFEPLNENLGSTIDYYVRFCCKAGVTY